MTEIKNNDLQDLLQYFSKNTYQAKDADSTSQGIMQRCILLANMDYNYTVIDNINSDLSTHYPSHLILLEYEKHKYNCDSPPPHQTTTETIYESLYDSTKLKEMMKNAGKARCRSRFPLPVILYKGRHVCRSATLSSGPEIYGRSGIEYLFASNEAPGKQSTRPSTRQLENERSGSDSDYWHKFDIVRSYDIALLKELHVGTIIDFMVEKKKVKFFLNVTSSEKVDKEGRYSDFTLISLPYPGCEFFKEFRENDYTASGLQFDWSQAYVDADIGVPEDSITSQLPINWKEYQHWDLVKLTQNYLKLILKYLNDSSSGILIHCISGWDRTPLFISLLRIVLWADGVIHKSLSVSQLLYFTIAYDWMLFGHHLSDRLAKGEEIFYFCFYVLKHLLDEEFSIYKRHSGLKTSVLRNDSDSQLDNVMFEAEPIGTMPLTTVSSNLSLNSVCSNVSLNSRDSQDNNPPAVFHCNSSDSQEETHSNGNVHWTQYTSQNKDASTHNSRSSPLPSSTLTTTNRTSPVAVPLATNRMRARNESSSSGGSWQMITGTGSLRGSSFVSNASLVPDNLPCSSCSSANSMPGQTSQDSSTTVIEEAGCNHCVRRKHKLEALRQLFYQVYNQTVGLKMKNNSDHSGLQGFIGTFAKGFGIGQRTAL